MNIFCKKKHLKQQYLANQTWKNLEKIFFLMYVKKGIDWYIYEMLIPTNNFWYYSSESEFRYIFGTVPNMIKLFILKLKGFSPIKVYIFEIYSSRAFEWYVAWRAKLPISKVTDAYFLEKKRLKQKYLANRTWKNLEKMFFLMYV